MAAKPSFLIATPTRIGRTKVGLNMGQALAELGHRVAYFDYDRKPLHLRLLPRTLRPQDWHARYLNFVNHQILGLADKIKPDIFLCVKGVQLFPETIRTLEAAGITTVGYWIDDPLDHQRSLANAPAYQHYFTNDASCVARYRQEGVQQIRHLPSSADTHTFYPLTVAAPIADVIFIGTHSAYRESIVAELQDFDLRVYGPGWHKSRLKKSCIHPEAFGAKTNWIFNHARINLNIHNWFGKGSAMNLRLFEVPAAGGFLLTDWVEEIDQAYTDNVHLACWRTVEELRQKIAYFLDHEEERHQIARQGHEHFLSHHAYGARVSQMLAAIGMPRT